MHADDFSAEPPRYSIPDGLRVQALGVAKWMQIVGILQTCVAGFAFAIVSCGVVAIAAGSVPWPVALVTLILLLVLGALVRQGLLLQSAAEHFKGLDEDPAEAHDRLQLAFARLGPMFAIDIAIGVLLVLRNALLGWGAA